MAQRQFILLGNPDVANYTSNELRCYCCVDSRNTQMRNFVRPRLPKGLDDWVRHLQQLHRHRAWKLAK